MNQPGIGVMIGMLSGNEETVKAYHSALGREIASARLDEEAREDGAIVLGFVGGGELTIWDGGRSCCESRYITTDDDLTDLVGKALRSIEMKEGPEEANGWGDSHETMFVEIVTDGGDSVTLTTHNEHNGYYGGFWLQLAAQGIAAPSGGETTGSTVGKSPVEDAPETQPTQPKETG